MEKKNLNQTENLRWEVWERWQRLKNYMYALRLDSEMLSLMYRLDKIIFDTIFMDDVIKFNVVYK